MPTPAPTNVIDTTAYAELQVSTGAEFAAELVGTFLEEAPPMLVELRSALASSNAERFRRAAHSLKSNSQTFGATLLAELARHLELGKLPANTVQLDALEAEYARAAAALRELARG